MPSLFNPSDNQQMIDRINNLTPDTKALWGKMNVSQMITHNQRPLQVAFGKLKLKKGLIGFLFGGIAKKQLLKDIPFKKNLPTAPGFVVKDERKFDEEKENLISLVERFVKDGPAGLTKEPHPFFGKLTTDEWDKLQWKHLEHHLSQFGV